MEFGNLIQSQFGDANVINNVTDAKDLLDRATGQEFINLTLFGK